MLERLGGRIFGIVLDDGSANEKAKLGRLIGWATLAFFVIFILYVIIFIIHIISHAEQPSILQNAGAFGDFIGGALNPVLSFLAFIGVLYSIFLQRNDLAESQKQTNRQFKNAELQRFEATIFRMLAIHDSIVNSIDVTQHNGSITRGRECFKSFHQKLKASYRKYEEYGALGVDHIRIAYKDFWMESRSDLGHYMRFIYNIIRYIDECEFGMQDISNEIKYKYVRILRSQISDYELVIIYYNMLSLYGEKFRIYSKKYDLLDNLPRDLLLDLAHFDFRSGMGKVDGEMAI